MKMRLRKCWAILADAGRDKATQLRAIDSLREEDKEIIHRAQLLGIFPKDFQINVENTQVNVQNFIKAEHFKEAYDKYFGGGSGKDQERQSPG